MKTLLTLFVLLFSSSVFGEEMDIIKLNDGANDYEAEAIAKTLSTKISHIKFAIYTFL